MVFSQYESGEEGKFLSRLNHAYAKLRNLGSNLWASIVNGALFNPRDVFLEEISVNDLEEKVSGRRMYLTYADVYLGDLVNTLCRKSSEIQHRMIRVNSAYASALCSRCRKMVPKDFSARMTNVGIVESFLTGPQ